MSNKIPPLRDRLADLAQPAKLICASGFHLIKVLLSTAVHIRSFKDVPALSQMRDKAFSNFWLSMTASPSDAVEEELSGSAVLFPPLFANARGVVLEIGPGSGSQFKHYVPAHASISKLYAAEPLEGLHGQLRANAQAAGLADVFEPLQCSAEPDSILPTLAKHGLVGKGVGEEGLFDTIVCVRVLCSISRPHETVDNLYQMLKPGGKLVIAEHVVNPGFTNQGSILARALQVAYRCLGWRFFMQCHLTRDTEQILMSVGASHGGWESNSLKRYFGWSALPYVAGELVKRRTAS